MNDTNHDRYISYVMQIRVETGNTDFGPHKTIGSWGCNQQWVSSGLGNGLVPNRQQAIIWTNGDPDIWCFILSLCHNELCGTATYSTHWGWVTHICVINVTITGSDNGLSPVRRQAIIGTNAAALLIGPLGTKLYDILIRIHTFSLKKVNLNMSSGKW